MVMVPSAWGTFWLCSRYLRVESTCQTGNSIPSSRWKHILTLRRFGGISFTNSLEMSSSFYMVEKRGGKSKHFEADLYELLTSNDCIDSRYKKIINID